MLIPLNFRHYFGVIFGTLVVFGVVCNAFSVAPNGLSGSYQNEVKDKVKHGKFAHYGVSWSRNLDAEIQQRKRLCYHIPVHLGYQYRYHNETRACYKIGQQGPCGENQIFFGYQTNAVFGQCDCNYNDNSRALIMDSERNMCHFVYSRAYCNVGEWLTFSSTWEPVCEANKCLKFYENIGLKHNTILPGGGGVDKPSLKAVSVEFVPYFGKSSTFSCVPLGLSCQDKDMDKESISQWGSLAHLPHEVQFIKGKLGPRCAPSSDHIQWRYPTPKMQCLPGSFLMAKSENGSKCGHRFEI